MFGRLFGTDVTKYKNTSNSAITLNNQAIDVKIVERYAKISYLFDFENTDDYGSKELKFEMTIDADAFISSFTADIDGDLYYGQTKEKQTAKREYVAAKQKDENAILISQIDKNIPNLFKIQTNIDAESEISLTITIEQYLKKKCNFNELNIEIVRDFNKYHISQNYKYISFNLNIVDKRGIFDVQLPAISDNINNILQIDENIMQKSTQSYTMKGKLRYKQSKVTEFVLKYKVKGEENEHSILYHQQSQTFVHIISDMITDSLISDTKDINEGHSDEMKEDSNVLIPRRVIFIIDRSYSMHGEKWRKTKEATINALKLLRVHYDRYSIVFFDQNIKQLTQNNNLLLANDANIKDSMSYVQTQKLGGSTDINSALLHGIILIKNDITFIDKQTLDDNYNFYLNLTFLTFELFALQEIIKLRIK